MKKLYIPTCTLNFNNIISSESISPCAFYPRRGYGYKSIDKVELNNFNNIILLYDKFPYFDIAESQIENYPMVIEVNMDSCNAKVKKVSAKGIYVCSETIYLNPFDTVFWFNNEVELIRTKAKTAPAVEAKCVNLYDGCLAVVDETIEKHAFPLKGIKDGKLNEAAIDADVRVDKLKGILYGYMLAYNTITDKQVAMRRMCIRALINALSATLSAPDFKPSMLRSKKLEALYEQLGSLVGKSLSIDDIVKQKEKEYGIKNFAEVLKKEGLYELWVERVSKKNNKKPLSNEDYFRLYPGENKMEALDRYEEFLYASLIGRGKPQKLITSDLLPIIDSTGVKSIPELKSFLGSLLNLYLLENVKKDDFLNNRYDYARIGVILCKDEMIKNGKDWTNSSFRVYLNALLSNLKTFDAFEINSTESLGIKSFAMFFQKANIDIHELNEFMTNNGEGDMRYVYSLWGAIFGFADMPKTLTAQFFDSEDEEYKVSMYKEIYKRLFNINLEGNLSKRRYKMPIKVVETQEVIPVVEVEPVKKEALKEKKSKRTSKKKVEASLPEISFEEVNEVLVDDIKPFNAEDFIRSLKTFSKFSEGQYKKLVENWKITTKKHSEKSEGQLSFFINLCSKQGREDVMSELYKVFTRDIADSLKQEINKRLNVNLK